MIYVNDKPVSMIPQAMHTVSAEGLNLQPEEAQIYPPANNYTNIRDALLRLGIKATYRAIQSDNFVEDTSGWKLSAEGVGYFAEGNIGGWNINATTIYSDGNNIILDSANKKIESGNYVSGYAGAGFHIDEDLAEFGNIACRGIFRSAVMQYDNTFAYAGNQIVAKGADVLKTTMTAADNSTVEIENDSSASAWAVGDILKMDDANNVEWFEITSVSGNVYTCDRDKKGDYGAGANPEWEAGAAVMNYGQSGDGGIYTTASEANAPYLSIFTHAGSPWTDITTRLRIGNLNGYLGYTTDKYGIGIGDSTHYLKYDPTNHLRIRGTITIDNPGDIDQTTLANSAAAGADVTLSAINGGLAVTGGGITLSSGGSIKGGQTAYATGTGFFLGYEASAYKFSIGDTTTNLKWTGTALEIEGKISATAGSDIPLAYVTEEFTAAENIAQYDAVYMVRAEATTIIASDDSYVEDQDDHRDDNNGSGNQIYISYGSSGYEWRSLLKFTITGHSNLENYKVILRLKVSMVESDDATWAVYKVNADWAEGTVTWNNQPANDIAAGMKKATFSTTSATDWAEVDVTELFRQWNDGSNYGLIIKNDCGFAREIGFYSSEAAEGNRPQLCIYDDTHADVGKIKKAKADDPITCCSFVGVATEAITSGNIGKVKTFGKTTVSGNSSYPGTGLIISATTAGQLVPQPTTDDQYVVNVGIGRTSGNPTISAFIQPPKLQFRKYGITPPAGLTESGKKLQVVYIGFRPSLIKVSGQYYNNGFASIGTCNCVGAENSITQYYQGFADGNAFARGAGYVYHDGTRTCKIKFIGENYIVLEWNNVTTNHVKLDIEAFQ